MEPTILQRLTAWLCLAVALLTGVTPANGLMLCLEPDGCVRIEIVRADPICGGCEGHEEDAAPGTPTAQLDADDSDCPCVDLPLPGATQEHRLQPRPIELQLGPWEPDAEAIAASSLDASVFAARAPPVEVPRPSESVALIRTVVLLV